MESKQLKSILQDAARIKPKNLILPIIEHLLINGNQIEFTDMETHVIYTFPEKIADPCTIDIQDLKKILTAIGANEDLQITALPDYRVMVKCESGEFTFQGEDPEDFPDAVESGFDYEGKLTSGDIGELKKAVNFVSDDELRMAMMGVYVGKGEICATNAHYLFHSKLQGECEPEMIIPVKAISVMDNQDYTITKSERYLKCKEETKTIVTRLIDAKYPNWRDVIPEKRTSGLAIDNKEFQKTVKTALVMATKETNKVTLIMNHECFVHSEDLEFNKQFDKKIDAEYLGEELKISFNGQMMLSILKTINEKTVKLWFETENRAITIEDSYLLMPVMA